jgi:chemotaxis protein methyltransferase CheR
VCSRTFRGTDVTVVSPSLLARLNGFVETRMGLHFPPTRLSDLQRGICAAAVEFGFSQVESCIEWLLSSASSPDRIKTLAYYLTVGDTYFFRDKGVFQILEKQVLPEIIDSRRGREQNLRIWSAGCSTGEEPYSLAIMLARLLPDLQDWKTTILATDINPVSLAKAAAGVYREWSFRDTPSWVKEGYFKRGERNLEVIPPIKRMVTFSCLNLAQDPYHAISATDAMDIIFCRNVLMYFSRERAQKVIHKLADCLVDGGWLVVSPVDVPGTEFPPILRPVRFPDAILFKKEMLLQDPILHPKPHPPRAIREPAVVGATGKIPHGRAKRHVPQVPVPEVSDRLGKQARQLADQGRLAEALAVCEEAVQSDKLNPALHYLQATILQEMGRVDDAVASLQCAVYIDQDFAMAHFALGHMMPRDRQKEAGKHLEKAISLLEVYGPGEIPPEGEGMSAGRLMELITTMQGIEGWR